MVRAACTSISSLSITNLPMSRAISGDYSGSSSADIYIYILTAFVDIIHTVKEVSK